MWGRLRNVSGWLISSNLVVTYSRLNPNEKSRRNSLCNKSTTFLSHFRCSRGGESTNLQVIVDNVLSQFPLCIL